MSTTLSVGRKGAVGMLLGLVLLGAMAALNRLDMALAGAHTTKTASGGLGDIANFSRIWTSEVSLNVAEGWDKYNEAFAGQAVPARSVTYLTIAYLVCDLVLMASLARLLFIVREANLPAVVPTAEDWPLAAHTVLDKSRYFIWGYLAFDFIETTSVVAAWPLLAKEAKWLAISIGVASLAKWLCLAGALAGLGIQLAYRSRNGDGLRAWLLALKALRGQVLVGAIIVAFLLGLQGDLGRQIDDVLVRAADGVLPALLATALTLATCAAILIGGSLCLQAYDDPPPITPVSGRARVAKVIGVLGVSAGVAGALGAPAVAWSLSVPAGVLLVWLLLTFLEPVGALGPVEETVGDVESVSSGRAARLLLVGLAAAPAVALYLATVGAAASQLAGDGEPVLLAVWVAVSLALSCAVLVAANASEIAGGPWTAGQLAFPVLLCLAALALLALLPHQTWMWIGTPAVVFLFTTMLAVLVGLFVLLSDAVAPSGPMALIGFKRMPFIAMLLIWGFIASTTDNRGAYYEARVTSDKPAAGAESPSAAYKTWLALQTPQPEAVHTGDKTNTPDRRVVPLVFVASAGGGIRAAYWSATTWDCVVGLGCGDHVDHTAEVFFASGVSGGAMGLAQVRAHQMRASENGASTTETATSESWVDTALGEDFLAPAVAAFAFRDLPNSIARLPINGQDRAAALEKAFESANDGMGDDFVAEGRPFPRLAFSGTSAEDGCRLSVSDLTQAVGSAQCSGSSTSLPDSSGPGGSPVRDATDYTCVEGESGSLRLSTAAVLSARFPFVSPAGGLGPCKDGGTTYSVDGGLFDNSAGSAVTAVWSAVERDVATTNKAHGVCVVPRLLVVDSHYDSTALADPLSRPLQSAAPLGSLLNVYGRRDGRALADATRAIERGAQAAARACANPALAENAVVQIYPRANTAPQPPLGWTLSKSTRENLKEQLIRGCPDAVSAGETLAPVTLSDSAPLNNCAAISQVRSWFSPKGD